MPTKLASHIFALSLALSSILTSTAVAQTPTSAKIGIANIQDAIAATNQGKKEFDALKQRFEPKQAELKTQNDALEALKKDLQAKQGTLSGAEKARQANNIEAKQQALQQNYEAAQNEFQKAEQEVVNRLGTKMLNVLDKYATDNGYAVILDVSNPQTPVLWASKAANITKELVDAYNASPR